MTFIRHLIPTVLLLVLALTACGSPNSTPPVTNPPIDEPAPEGPLSGQWTGTIVSQTLGTSQATLDLTQVGPDITGDFTIVPPSGNQSSDVIAGTMTSGNNVLLFVGVTIDNQHFTLNFTGNLNGTTVSGTVSIIPPQGSGDTERGTFTITKSAQE